MDCEDWLEGGEDLLECLGFLGIGSFLSGEGLLEGAVLFGDSFLSSDHTWAEGSLLSEDSLTVRSCLRGEDLLGGEGDDDLTQADCDAHLWVMDLLQYKT